MFSVSICTHTQRLWLSDLVLIIQLTPTGFINHTQSVKPQQTTQTSHCAESPSNWNSWSCMFYSPTVTTRMLFQELSGTVLTLHTLSHDELSAVLYKVHHSGKCYLFYSTLIAIISSVGPHEIVITTPQSGLEIVFTEIMFPLGSVTFDFTMRFVIKMYSL